jgi:hypothetical protein
VPIQRFVWDEASGSVSSQPKGRAKSGDSQAKRSRKERARGFPQEGPCDALRPAPVCVLRLRVGWPRSLEISCWQVEEDLNAFAADESRGMHQFPSTTGFLRSVM